MINKEKVHPKDFEFSKLRTVLWPIQKAELKKFLPMALIMFLILFNYTLLRNVKDALLITAHACGAEVIPFLKIFGGMPSAVLLFFIYIKLSNILSREKLFYICLIPFLVFFFAFAFIIYPNIDVLHPTQESIVELREAFPNAKWFISLYGVWSFAIFYILSELWGVIVLALLFWQFANEITRTREAKRFYPFFGLLGQLALIMVGLIIHWFPDNEWESSIKIMMMGVLAIGTLIIALYWWMNRYVLNDPFYYDSAESVVHKKKEDKPKLSIMESLRYLFSSKYLGLIALLVLSYGISMNVIDVVWKSQINDYYPKASDYMAYMGAFSTWTGIGTIALMFCTKGIVKRFGWFSGAIIPPLIFITTSVFFFIFVIFKDNFDSQVAYFNVTSVYMAVMIGAIQNILTKGTKYSLFDPTKEMAYIPLDQELRVKGKAAVDVIGGRLGKSGGGFIQVLLLSLTEGSQLSIAPYLFGVILIGIFVWIGAVKRLSVLYNDRVKEKCMGQIP